MCAPTPTSLPECFIALAAARQCCRPFPDWKFTSLRLHENIRHIFTRAPLRASVHDEPLSHLLVWTTSPLQRQQLHVSVEGCSEALCDSLEVPGGFQVFGVIFERAVESQAVGRALHLQGAGGRGCRDQRMRACRVHYLHTYSGSFAASSSPILSVGLGALTRACKHAFAINYRFSPILIKHSCLKKTTKKETINGSQKMLFFSR